MFFLSIRSYLNKTKTFREKQNINYVFKSQKSQNFLHIGNPQISLNCGLLDFTARKLHCLLLENSEVCRLKSIKIKFCFHFPAIICVTFGKHSIVHSKALFIAFRLKCSLLSKPRNLLKIYF